MAATEEKDVEKTISEDLVVTKYKLAGEIVNSKYNTDKYCECFETLEFVRPSAEKSVKI